MTNREKFKDDLDAMLLPIMAVVNGKPVICDNANCRECLFTKNCGKNEHKQEIIDWLNAEYQEPSVDWSKGRLTRRFWLHLMEKGGTADTSPECVTESRKPMMWALHRGL